MFPACLKIIWWSCSGEITYKGEKNVAFGIEIYQINYNSTDNTFKFHEVTETTYLRKVESPVLRRGIEPALIEDPEKGDVFLPII